ncbi:MAG: biotin/lipoyl-binding protein [Bacteroidales bacterium]|nr:biotin/lipoyl-binding protein [Bacteroidales bacterium]
MKRFKFTIRGNEYETEVLKFKASSALIEVNGTRYEVELHKENTKPEFSIKRPARTQEVKSNPNTPKSNVYAVKAPLPGIILQVFVKEGDTVAKDDKLLIYEAMKMENLLKSDKEGTVKSVKVKASDAILQDEVLMELEMEHN